MRCALPVVLSVTSLIAFGCAPAGPTASPGSDAGVALMITPGTDAGPGAVSPDTDAGPGSTPTGPTGTDAGASFTPVPDAGGPVSLASSGGACNCDSECPGTPTNPGVCLEGVCMNRASGECASPGSTAGCPAGSRCWGLEGVTGGICWPDCDSVSCAGACDSDGSCVWSDSTTCDSSCSDICSGPSTGGCPPNSHPVTDGCACDAGYAVNSAGTGCEAEAPECTPGSCGTGMICSGGHCVVDLGSPPTGPIPSCAGVPDWRCVGGESYCGQLVNFDPAQTGAYWDYMLNGEGAGTDDDRYRSWIRRDVMMLVRYAAGMVECQAAGWAGGGGPLALGDMSERSGAIPGTRDGSPGHPAGTHVGGRDMDIGYFQTGTDNRLRPVCPHTNSDGSDAYHCTAEPTTLDVWRTALVLGHFHASPNLRVIGVDGRVGSMVTSALRQLCDAGWVTTSACTSPQLAYETVDEGRGWYHFHHHHFHISVSAP